MWKTESSVWLGFESKKLGLARLAFSEKSRLGPNTTKYIKTIVNQQSQKHAQLYEIWVFVLHLFSYSLLKKHHRLFGIHSAGPLKVVFDLRLDPYPRAILH